MTDYYVGPGGDNSKDGLSWAERKLTLTNAEASLSAGDNLYIGPGRYRELVTLTESGTSGNPITYIGDVVGIYTDHVGGPVVITGADNDYSAPTRASAITIGDSNEIDYRTFRGLTLENCSLALFSVNPTFDVGYLDHLIIEDCVFFNRQGGEGNAGKAIDIDDQFGGTKTFTIRRCIVIKSGAAATHAFTLRGVGANTLIENCLFLGGQTLIRIEAADVVVKNCSIHPTNSSGSSQMQILTTNATGTVKIYNCLIAGWIWCLTADNAVEDYNIWHRLDPTDDVKTGLTGDGANSYYRKPIYQENPLVPDEAIFMGGIGTPKFSRWSDIPSYGCGQSPPSEDVFGITRPTSDSKKTRGAIQYNTVERETTIVPTGETESIKLRDAMAHQIIVPVTGRRMSFEVQVYREANYAGTNPQMIIKQPGQADRTETDAAAASQWNTLSDAFTPASVPSYAIIELRSDNTASSGSYAAYFGGIKVK